MKSRKERIIDALMILKKDAPELYIGLINGECPHEAGLSDENRDLCGMDDTDSAFVMGYCRECWKLAMEGVK